MDREPRITVGMPVYNAARYLEESIESILSQTFSDLGLLISDNASTDQTESLCAEYARRDQRVRYVRNKINMGYAYNFNQVYRLSRGDYFKWAAYDDVCSSDFIELCVDALERHPKAVLAYGDLVPIDDEGATHPSLAGTLDFTDSALLANPDPVVRFQSLMHNLWGASRAFYGVIRSEALETTPLHGYFHGADHVLLSELSLRGPFLQVPEARFFMRRHAAQGSAAKTVSQRSSNAIGGSAGKTLRGSLAGVGAYRTRVAGYLAAIRRAPLTREQKLRCAAITASTVGRWLKRPGAGGYKRNNLDTIEAGRAERDRTIADP